MNPTAHHDTFLEKSGELRAAQTTVGEAKSTGRAVGFVMLGAPAWWLASAPYWAIPFFLFGVAWFVGRVCEYRAFGREQRRLAALGIKV